MKYSVCLFTIMVMILSACTGDKRIDNYNKIVDGADKIRFYHRVGDSFALSRELVSPESLQNLKSILKRHIEPADQRKFIGKYKIEIYQQGNLQGVLLISGTNEDPFVNFSNGSSGFGFKLTYGIGMIL